MISIKRDKAACIATAGGRSTEFHSLGWGLGEGRTSPEDHPQTYENANAKLHP
jgi:hypothetical protein